MQSNHEVFESRIYLRMYPRDQLFSEKRKFKRLKMDGLNDTIRIKKNEVDLILYSFTPSDMNFQTIWMSQVFLAKKFVREKLVPWNYSYLRYALI